LFLLLDTAKIWVSGNSGTVALKK